MAEIGLTKTAAAFTKDFDGVESFFMGNALKFNPFSEQKKTIFQTMTNAICTQAFKKPNKLT